mmetsp:Transcript_8399/g.11306  ORF Transcript_8399/g.11306 Transcript_8399/m.11306 type:complete len:311 (-) Transcript_8399:31-963(-)
MMSQMNPKIQHSASAILISEKIGQIGQKRTQLQEKKKKREEREKEKRERKRKRNKKMAEKVSPVLFWAIVTLSLLAPFTVSLFALVSSVGWCVVYYLLGLSLRHYDREIDGYPLYSYISSMVHQGLTLIVLALILFFTKNLFTPENFHPWIKERWIEEEDFWEIQIFCSIVGAMMKDYWLFGRENPLPFLLHHLFTFWGCSLSLHFPVGKGLLTLNGIQAESFSVFYNLKMVFPSIRLSTYAHLILMPISNALALWISYTVYSMDWHKDVEPWMTNTYVTLGCLIVVLRCAGWFLTLAEQFESKAEKKAK